MKKNLNRPGVFIASSGKGLRVAELVRKNLAHFAECVIWTETFGIGLSTYDQLVQSSAFYDYGIFIATADDPIFSKEVFSVAPRDNVVFELGLFTGSLGRGRAIMLLEEGAKELSDLNGITMPRIKPEASSDFENSVAHSCKSIVEHIQSRKNVFNLSTDASSVLAYGYFYNFVERMVDRVREDVIAKKRFALVDGTSLSFDSVQMKIYIPDDLNEDVFKKARNMNREKSWQKLKVDPKEERDYDFYVSVSAGSDKSHLDIHDIPYTLNSLQKTIEAISKSGFIGKTEYEVFLERKVLRDFKATLDYLISKSSTTKGYVETEYYSF